MDILYGILHKIINMSITGTIAILAVLVIRMLLSRAPKNILMRFGGLCCSVCFARYHCLLFFQC